MKNGYLEENSIDALSNDVGYASRTSLYKVFLEIEGCSLPAFRKSLSLDSD
jgi:AraC-like DNA-binding protein